MLLVPLVALHVLHSAHLLHSLHAMRSLRTGRFARVRAPPGKIRKIPLSIRIVRLVKDQTGYGGRKLAAYI